ncbi:MAG: lanthionine synthetase LanC family protein [Bacteroidales bacterium]
MFDIDRLYLKKQLVRICDVLSFNNKEIHSAPIGLYTGLGGVALFWSNLYVLTKDKYYQREASKFISLIISKINNKDERVNYSFSDGIAGIGWLISQMVEGHIIDGSNINIFTNIEISLYNKMNNDIHSNNYELLYGASGIALYFYSKVNSNEEYKNSLVKFAKEICILSIEERDGTNKWLSKRRVNDELMDVFDISMSHGFSALVVILSKLYNYDREFRFVYNSILRGMNYIIKQKLEDPNVSLYPSYSLESDAGIKHSRLGWCYGDLSILNMLQNTRIVNDLNDNYIRCEIVKILEFTNKRRGYTMTQCSDITFCHGAVGIYYILYKYRAILNYKIVTPETIEYWHNVFCDMTNDAMGFHNFTIDSKSVNKYGILVGLAGVGLGLIGITYNYTKWDECLLLS